MQKLSRRLTGLRIEPVCLLMFGILGLLVSDAGTLDGLRLVVLFLHFFGCEMQELIHVTGKMVPILGIL